MKLPYLRTGRLWLRALRVPVTEVNRGHSR